MPVAATAPRLIFPWASDERNTRDVHYRGTSLIRNSPTP